jgi:hypothetical protein
MYRRLLLVVLTMPILTGCISIEPDNDMPAKEIIRAMSDARLCSIVQPREIIPREIVKLAFAELNRRGRVCGIRIAINSQ